MVIPIRIRSVFSMCMCIWWICTTHQTYAQLAYYTSLPLHASVHKVSQHFGKPLISQKETLDWLFPRAKVLVKKYDGGFYLNDLHEEPDEKALTELEEWLLLCAELASELRDSTRLNQVYKTLSRYYQYRQEDSLAQVFKHQSVQLDETHPLATSRTPKYTLEVRRKCVAEMVKHPLFFFFFDRQTRKYARDSLSTEEPLQVAQDISLLGALLLQSPEGSEGVGLLLDIALDIFANNQADLDMIIVYLGLRNLKLQENKFAEALQYDKELAEIISPYEDLAPLLGMVYASSAGIYSEMGKYEMALELTEKALSLLSTKNKWTQAKEYIPLAHSLVGNVYLNLGLYEQAEYHYLQGLKVIESQTNRPSTNELQQLEIKKVSGPLHGSLAQAYLLRDNIEAAWTHALRTLEIADSLMVDFQKLSAGNMYLIAFESVYQQLANSMKAFPKAVLGLIYLRQHDFNEAIAYHDEALQILKQTSFSHKYFEILFNKGVIQTMAGQAVAGMQTLKKAAAKAKASGAQNQLCAAYLGLSDAAIAMGEISLAADFLQKALDLANKIEDQHLLARTMIKLGNIYAHTDRLDEAENLCKRALSIKELRQDADGYKNAYEVLGRIYYFRSNPAKSFHYFKRVIDSTDHQAMLHKGEGSQIRIAQSSINAYEGAIIALEALGSPHQAFEICEKVRSRTLNQLLSQKQILGKNIPPDLAKKTAALSAEINKNNFLKARTASETKRAAYTRKNALLAEELRLVMNEVKERDPRYKQLTYLHRSLTEIQGILHSDEVLLEYYIGRDSAYVFIIGKEQEALIPLHSSWRIRQVVNQFQQEFFVLPGKKDLLQEFAMEKIFFQHSSELYRLLLTPILKEQKLGKKKLLIVPDGDLNKIPFELLISDKQQMAYTQYQYLVKDHEISYLPSAKFLYDLRTHDRIPRSYTTTFMGFGNPDFEPKEIKQTQTDYQLSQFIDKVPDSLPYSDKEVRQISALFSDQGSQVFLGADASESKLKALSKSGELAQSKYVHFSTHGVIDYVNPSFSRLLLANKGDLSEDGYLQLFEIFRLKLQSELVSLSACETALGKILPGEGVMGFARSFLYAGTPSLIISLWQVTDLSTSKFFYGYYERLKNNRETNKYSPLRQTQLEMIRTKKHANPLYWAPFIFIGEH